MTPLVLATPQVSDVVCYNLPAWGGFIRNVPRVADAVNYPELQACGLFHYTDLQHSRARELRLAK